LDDSIKGDFVDFRGALCVVAPEVDVGVVIVREVSPGLEETGSATLVVM